jgi:D-alanyl-D-alanine carboxypeptidase
MQQVATEDSVTMYLISGFRSIERQAELIEARLTQGQPLSEVLSVLAPPGCSEHHTGRAVDIGAPGFAGDLCSNLVYQWGLIDVEEAAHRC